MYFDGSDYVPERDGQRLTIQFIRIFNLMKDGQARTLPEISSQTGDPPASVSAQLRHMRKPRFGGHQVLKDYLGNGLYSYRLVLALSSVGEIVRTGGRST